jgi:hypothetical protein
VKKKIKEAEQLEFEFAKDMPQGKINKQLEKWRTQLLKNTGKQQ